MKTNEDFHNIDQSASKEILKEFKDQQVEETCQTCKGQGKLFAGTPKESPCEECIGQGFKLIEY